MTGGSGDYFGYDPNGIVRAKDGNYLEGNEPGRVGGYYSDRSFTATPQEMPSPDEGLRLAHVDGVPWQAYSGPQWDRYTIETIYREHIMREQPGTADLLAREWHSMGQILQVAAQRLRAQTVDLAGQWQSPAAKDVFLHDIGRTLSYLDDWRDAAYRNSRALSGLAHVMREAQSAIQPLWDKYQEWRGKWESQAKPGELPGYLETKIEFDQKARMQADKAASNYAGYLALLDGGQGARMQPLNAVTHPEALGMPIPPGLAGIAGKTPGGGSPPGSSPGAPLPGTRTPPNVMTPVVPAVPGMPGAGALPPVPVPPPLSPAGQGPLRKIGGGGVPTVPSSPNVPSAPAPTGLLPPSFQRPPGLNGSGGSLPGTFGLKTLTTTPLAASSQIQPGNAATLGMSPPGPMLPPGSGAPPGMAQPAKPDATRQRPGTTQGVQEPFLPPASPHAPVLGERKQPRKPRHTRRSKPNGSVHSSAAPAVLVNTFRLQQDNSILERLLTAGRGRSRADRSELVADLATGTAPVVAGLLAPVPSAPNGAVPEVSALLRGAQAVGERAAQDSGPEPSADHAARRAPATPTPTRRPDAPITDDAMWEITTPGGPVVTGGTQPRHETAPPRALGNGA